MAKKDALQPPNKWFTGIIHNDARTGMRLSVMVITSDVFSSLADGEVQKQWGVWNHFTHNEGFQNDQKVQRKIREAEEFILGATQFTPQQITAAAEGLKKELAENKRINIKVEII